MTEPKKTELQAELEEARQEIVQLKNQITELEIDVHQATRQYQGYLYMERLEYRKLAMQAEVQMEQRES